MKLSEIEAKYEENDYGFPLYDAEQMQEYAKAKVLETVELYAKDGSTVPVDFIKEFVLKIIFEEGTKND